jgi:DNA-binding winged helix-turn-helix (wHTH) protein
MKSLQWQIRFGQFRFDEERRDPQCEGVPLPASMQALALLAALLAESGALLSKDELMKAAWPGLHVEEGEIFGAGA